MTLRQAIDYIWLGQAFLTVLPWSVDPEVARMVRTRRCRVRATSTARHVCILVRACRRAPNGHAALARHPDGASRRASCCRLLGMSEWATVRAGRCAGSGVVRGLNGARRGARRAAIATLMDIITVATLSERGVNSLIGPIIIVFSGNLIPLPLFPEWMQPALRVPAVRGAGRHAVPHLQRPPRGDARALCARSAGMWVVVLVASGSRVHGSRHGAGSRRRAADVNALRLYGRYVAVSLRAQMQYPGAFIATSAGAFASTVIDFIAIWALFTRFRQIEGWRFEEVALFYGVISVAFAFADALTRGFDIFGELFVKTGDFDRLLVRPRSTVLQLLGYELARNAHWPARAGRARVGGRRAPVEH